MQPFGAGLVSNAAAAGLPRDPARKTIAVRVAFTRIEVLLQLDIELSGLELPVLMGSRFPVELKFERAGNITVEFIARFHSPKLTRRIREAAARGDIEALKELRPTP